MRIDLLKTAIQNEILKQYFKKSLFLFFQFLTIIGYSQSYINPNAEWNFETEIIDQGYTQYTQWKYLNDTVIGNKTYQIVGRKLTNLYSNSSTFSYTSNSYLYRTQGDSIYISKNYGIDEYLLYDFTPIIGNTWDVLPLLHGSLSSPTTSQYVQTVGWGDTLINGNTVHWIDIISLNPDSLYFSGKIFNHFGRRQLLPSWDDGALDHQLFLWKCYRDDIIGNITYTTCQDFETLNLNDVSKCYVNILPDPFNKRLNLENNNCISHFSIVIYDLMGRTVFKLSDVNTNQVNLFMPTGIYICIINGEKLNISKMFSW